MKPILAAAAVILALGVSANAADMPVKAPYYKAAPAFSWTGFYVGAHVGYGWGKMDFTNALVPVFNDSLDPSGVFGGFQGGYNWQFNPNWVFGIEADISGTNLDDDKVGPGSLPFRFEDEIKSFGTVRARLGYASGMDMLYVTGGWAWLRNEARNSIGATAETISKTHSGFAVGGGWEHAITPNWILKAEYLYLDVGHENYAFPTLPGAATPFRADGTLHTVRLGVNYKF